MMIHTIFFHSPVWTQFAMLKNDMVHINVLPEPLIIYAMAALSNPLGYKAESWINSWCGVSSESALFAERKFCKKYSKYRNKYIDIPYFGNKLIQFRRMWESTRLKWVKATWKCHRPFWFRLRAHVPRVLSRWSSAQRWFDGLFQPVRPLADTGRYQPELRQDIQR